MNYTQYFVITYKGKESVKVCVCVCVCVCFKSLQSCLTLCNPHGLQPTRLLCPWDSLGKNARVGCHFLLQGIFLIQGLNPCLMSHTLAGRFFTTSTTWEAILKVYAYIYIYIYIYTHTHTHTHIHTFIYN